MNDFHHKAVKVWGHWILIQKIKVKRLTAYPSVVELTWGSEYVTQRERTEKREEENKRREGKGRQDNGGILILWETFYNIINVLSTHENIGPLNFI